MKKTYINPEIDIICSRSSEIVCGSPSVEFGNGEYDGPMHAKDNACNDFDDAEEF